MQVRNRGMGVKGRCPRDTLSFLTWDILARLPGMTKHPGGRGRFAVRDSGNGSRLHNQQFVSASIV